MILTIGRYKGNFLNNDFEHHYNKIEYIVKIERVDGKLKAVQAEFMNPVEDTSKAAKDFIRPIGNNQ